MLEIKLRSARDHYRANDEPELIARYVNTGDKPLALAFWWHRTMRVRDAADRVITPEPGPVLPCGVAEHLEILAPSAAFERPEPLACTQPAGQAARIGWSYTLAPGRYRIVLVFEAPPLHGFTQHAADPREFRGKVSSNELSITIASPGVLAKLFGR
jgi:hypothetical protein